MNWAMLALLAFAASRATHLVADDLFPFGALRDWADEHAPYFGHGLGCTFCVSIWAGGAASGLALWQGWAYQDWWVFLALWFAFAEVIVLTEGLVEYLMGEGR